VLARQTLYHLSMPPAPRWLLHSCHTGAVSSDPVVLCLRLKSEYAPGHSYCEICPLSRSLRVTLWGFPPLDVS
jgi:hypothetical protein